MKTPEKSPAIDISIEVSNDDFDRDSNLSLGEAAKEPSIVPTGEHTQMMSELDDLLKMAQSPDEDALGKGLDAFEK